MGNCHMYIIECFHSLRTPESERLKVTALNLFHPTASPPFQKFGFFILRHSLQGRGRSKVDMFFHNRCQGLNKPLRKVKRRCPFKYHPQGLGFLFIKNVDIVENLNMVRYKTDRYNENFSNPYLVNFYQNAFNIRTNPSLRPAPLALEGHMPGKRPASFQNLIYTLLHIFNIGIVPND